MIYWQYDVIYSGALALLIRAIVYFEFYRVVRNFGKGLRERGKNYKLLHNISNVIQILDWTSEFSLTAQIRLLLLNVALNVVFIYVEYLPIACVPCCSFVSFIHMVRITFWKKKSAWNQEYFCQLLNNFVLTVFASYVERIE